MIKHRKYSKSDGDKPKSFAIQFAEGYDKYYGEEKEEGVYNHILHGTTPLADRITIKDLIQRTVQLKLSKREAPHIRIHDFGAGNGRHTATIFQICEEIRQEHKGTKKPSFEYTATEPSKNGLVQIKSIFEKELYPTQRHSKPGYFKEEKGNVFDFKDYGSATTPPPRKRKRRQKQRNLSETPNSQSSDERTYLSGSLESADGVYKVHFVHSHTEDNLQHIAKIIGSQDISIAMHGVLAHINGEARLPNKQMLDSVTQYFSHYTLPNIHSVLPKERQFFDIMHEKSLESVVQPSFVPKEKGAIFYVRKNPKTGEVVCVNPYKLFTLQEVENLFDINQPEKPNFGKISSHKYSSEETLVNASYKYNLLDYCFSQAVTLPYALYSSGILERSIFNTTALSIIKPITQIFGEAVARPTMNQLATYFAITVENHKIRKHEHDTGITKPEDHAPKAEKDWRQREASRKMTPYHSEQLPLKTKNPYGIISGALLRKESLSGTMRYTIKSIVFLISR